MKNSIGRLLFGLIVVAGLTACASKPDVANPGQGAVAPADPPKPSADSGHGASTNVQVASAGSPVVPADSIAAKPAPWGDATVATVNKRKPIAIPMAELVQPLIESHGLEMLLNIVQRDLAKQGADEANIVVTSEDFKAERERTLNLLFRELDEKLQDMLDKAEKAKDAKKIKEIQEGKEADHKQLLNQFYEQKHLTPTDFDIVIQTNTYLRKIADPQIEGKITEQMLRGEFAARYGEQVRVRFIQLKRPQDAVEVKRRLAAGEKFEDVARDLSINRDTAALGGELLPFTRAAPLPKVFKDVAFDLKDGQVSDLVNANDSFYIIKLEQRIQPKAVVYDQQRDILFRDVHEQMVQVVIAQMRQNIAVAVRESLKISDPTMSKQFQERLDELSATARGREAAEQEMAREHDRLRLEEQLRAQHEAATQPAASRPALPAATQPLAAPAPRAVAPAPVAPVAPPVPVAPAPTRPAAVPATAPSAARLAPRAAASATRPG